MATTTFTSSSIGSKLAAATGTKITGISVTQPTATAEVGVPITLLDKAADSADLARTLFSADLIALSSIFAIKPNGPSVAPGLTAPTWPMSVATGVNIPFANGVWVQNCPVGVTVTLITG